jgi:hypothetical protein
MTGSLSFDGDDTERYIDEVFDGGRLETTITSICHEVDRQGRSQ